MSAKIINNSEEITNRQLNYNKKKQHQIAKEKRKAERKMNKRRTTMIEQEGN